MKDGFSDGEWIAMERSIRSRFCKSHGAGDRLMKLPLQSWREGVPQFPITKNGLDAERVASLPHGGKIGTKRDTHMDVEGNVYALSTRGADHTGGWPDRNYGGHPRFTKWDANGNVLWSVGKQALVRGRGANHREARPGTWHEPADISGETEKAIFVTDRVKNPAEVYAKNGLYLGYVGETRADDGLPAHVYETGPSSTGIPGLMGGDSAHGGSVAVYDGNVYWLAPESQTAVVYRIHGWEDWRRMSRSVTIDSEQEGATGEGNGLLAQYYSNPDLTGEAATTVEGPIWFGINRRVSRNVFSTIFDGNGISENGHIWGDRGPRSLNQKTNFSVRWRGELEPEFSEEYRFSVYARGAFRLWVNGKQRMWRWGRPGEKVKNVTAPISLSAGERVPIQLEFRSTASYPAFSLNWESFSQDRERIPGTHLYPTVVPIAQPTARPATKWIDATNFDASKPEDVTGHGMVEGYRGRKFASDKAWVKYELDFGSGVSTLEILMDYRWRDRGQPKLVCLIGGSDGRVIGQAKLKKSLKNEHGKYETLRINVESVSGVQTFVLKHRYPNQNPHIHVRRFRFK